MRLFTAFFILYQIASYNTDAKGLTMITRGCIANYLNKNQLLDASFKIGPVPSLPVCNNIMKNTVKTVIDDAIKSQMEFPEDSDDDVTTYKDCFAKLIEKYNMTDFLLKNYMYQEENVKNHEEIGLIADEILKLYDYLCHPGTLQEDFSKKFTNSFPGYEKEINRFCLVSLLRKKDLIDEDFDVNFEVSDASTVKCPDYINEDILNVKTEAFDLIHQNILYQNETIWECAASERLKSGYVHGYYRLMAYTFSHENDTRKTEERQKFLDVLRTANEVASICFKIGYESL